MIKLKQQNKGDSKMQSSFFSMIFRMKYINRWGLMRNTKNESLSEHSLEVAIIAHALGTIRNTRFGGNIDTEHLAVLGMFHDANEIITGDLPTPVKYHDKQIMKAYKRVENTASERLVALLPEDIRDEYKNLMLPLESDKELMPLLKAADKIAALIKCIDEERAGNKEFSSAKIAQEESIKKIKLPEVKVFMDEFIPAFYKTLDEQ